MASFKAVGQRYVVVSDPELAREILLTRAEEFLKGPALQNSKGILGEGLLTAEGETHKRARRMMQPAFHAKVVERYAGEIARSTGELMERWRGEAGAAMDVRGEMMGLTLVIAGRALFGTMLAGDIEKVRGCMDDLMNNYVRSVVPWGWILNLIPSATTRKLVRARAELFGLVERIIAERRGANGRGEDLLSMMIGATDSEGGGGARMTDQQVRDQAVTILTAGHETTANAMTFTLYLLAKFPEEQEKLREEVRGAVGDGEVTAEAADRLVRARWVLSESMRLYPPAWTLGRQNKAAMELGGYRLPAKCTILIPQWTLHRDGRFWEKPLEFLPERWREPKHPRFAYMPFSTGPRNCIGESFAWLEMVICLSMLVREFEFVLPVDAPEMKLTPAITLRPRGAVMMKVSKRANLMSGST